MDRVSFGDMNNLLTKGISSTDRFINIYHLNHNITYRTLLFYQFAYLNNLSKNEKEKEHILLSYLENDSDIKFVVIMSHDEHKRIYTLRRIKFDMDIYQTIKENFDDKDPIVINDSLIKTFERIIKEEFGWKERQIN